MKIKTTFGGAIGLEPLGRAGNSPHPSAIFMTSGRACMAAILDQQPHIKTVHVPFYTCNSLLAPMLARGIEVSYYPITASLLPQNLPAANGDQLVVLIDLFGIHGNSLTELGTSIGTNIVFDDTHAFHQGSRSSIHWSFNSARKFHGVPDGAYLFSPIELDAPTERNFDVRPDHLLLKLLEMPSASYAAFQLNEERMTSSYLMGSELSEALLARYDRVGAAHRRRDNFLYLHERLSFANVLEFNLNEEAVPYCYPFFPKGLDNLDRQRLYDKGLFLPTLWQDVIDRPDPKKEHAFEKDLTKRSLVLPVDQRYGRADMESMIATLESVIGKHTPAN